MTDRIVELATSSQIDPASIAVLAVAVVVACVFLALAVSLARRGL